MKLTKNERAVLRKIQSAGGNTTKNRYPKEHYSNLGKKGAAKRWGNKSE